MTTKTLRDIKALYNQVEYCLEHFPETRNSDTTLEIKLWETFYPEDAFKDGMIMFAPDVLYMLPHGEEVSRIRRKIQNDEKRFIPTDEYVAVKRGWKAEEWRAFALEKQGVFF